MLAEQTATLDRLSGGRFTLGIGVGGRADDFLATGLDVHTRGRRLDEVMLYCWACDPGQIDRLAGALHG
ncbi:LLM class flavin-dependent oxidoreductase [Nonomuraea sp. NPDC005983]|uniref:LLM class flavin-dependent oxidoreductase n=1 Tax=Nonomuraea sp. NPDC005983 TaxID=3155595 RepID=UPI0033BFB1A9